MILRFSYNISPPSPQTHGYSTEHSIWYERRNIIHPTVLQPDQKIWEQAIQGTISVKKKM